MAIIEVEAFTFYIDDVEFIYRQETSYHEKTHIKLKTGTKIICDYKDADRVQKAMKEYKENGIK